MKKIIIFIVMLFFIVSCNGNTSSSSLPVGTWKDILLEGSIVPADGYGTINPFNTVMYLKYFVQEDTDVENLQALYSNELIKLHKLFDRHYTYYIDDSNQQLGLISNVKTINQSYGKGEEIIVDEDLFNTLKLGIEYTKLSNGTFNILVGTLSSLWDSIFDDLNNFYSIEEIDPKFSSENQEKISKITSCIPNSDEIDEVIVLNEANSSVLFNTYVFNDEEQNNLCTSTDYRPSITLGGIGKGYATDKIVNLLNTNGYENGALMSGGSSISTLGASFLPDGQRVTIGDPRSTFYESKTAFNLRTKNKFNISTSGNYTHGKSYSFIDDVNEQIIYRHHILNPFDGIPSNFHRSVTVYSETVDAARLDAISTTLVNLSREDGLAFRESLIEVGINFDVVWINQEGDDRTCVSTKWCPLKPSKLFVYSTSNFNNSLNVAEGVTLSYVS